MADEDRLGWRVVDRLHRLDDAVGRHLPFDLSSSGGVVLTDLPQDVRRRFWSWFVRAAAGYLATGVVLLAVVPVLVGAPEWATWVGMFVLVLGFTVLTQRKVQRLALEHAPDDGLSR